VIVPFEVRVYRDLGTRQGAGRSSCCIGPGIETRTAELGLVDFVDTAAFAEVDHFGPVDWSPDPAASLDGYRARRFERSVGTGSFYTVLER
jgi:hypothetical protein